MIDLRSDTLTKPTVAMLNAMMAAPVGDDVYGEDPTVNELQEKVAKMFGMEDALFCPSGTMVNQIAIRISTQPQDQVICERRAHVYLYEGGGIAANSLASVRLLDGPRMVLSASDIEANINPDDVHFPRTSLICLENTCNKGGGSYYKMDQIASISEVAKNHQLRLHLDGARVFNALIETGESTEDYGKYFNTISVCLSKGLGAPVGSVLIGSKEDIYQAKRVRKMMGGGMRQAGILAAAGLYALDHHIDRLKDDHRRAKQIESVLLGCSWVSECYGVDTNIIAFRPDPEQITAQDLVLQLKASDILASTFDGGFVRFVTHLDIDDMMVEKTCEVLGRV